MNASASRMFAALSVRNFKLYFVGQLISVSGTWMQSVALGWLVLQLTGSSVDLGVTLALQFLPMLLLGSYGGVVADRSDKRRILFMTQSGAGALALVLGVAATMHDASIGLLYVLAGLLGVVNLFDNPARQSFVQQMVGSDLIANAVSLNSVLMNAGRLIGPGIATGLLTLFGTAVCFYVNAASYVAVLVALAMMDSSSLLPMRTVDREKGQVRLGLQYVARDPLLRRVILAIAVVGIFAYNFTVTLPLVTRITFHARSASDYGVLMAAMGFGAVVGGLLIAYRARPTASLLALITLAFGASMTLLSFAPSLPWAALTLVPTGASSIALIATANALLQTNSSQEMRGRVMSLYAIAFLGTTPIGSPLLGLIIRVTNPQVGLLVGAGSALATGAVLAYAAYHRPSTRTALTS